MRKITLTVLIFTIAVFSSFSQSTVDKEQNSAKIKFVEVEHDYGTIERNSNGACEFKFTNVGNASLILDNVRSSCGCTVPNWPKNPIGEGKDDVITVKYDTNRLGTFSKSITVYSNGSKQPIYLKIKGTVISKKV